MPIDKGDAGREQRQPSDWERITTEWDARAKAQRNWDATHDPSEEFEKAARPLPLDYGKDRPATRTVRPDQAEEMVELWGEENVDKLIASGKIVIVEGTEAAREPDITEANDAPTGESDKSITNGDERGDRDTLGDTGGRSADTSARTIEATRTEVEVAYATGDPATITTALRDALTKIEGSPERQTTWQTIADEMGGEVKSFPNYEAAKRTLGVTSGTEIHHLVEQAQAKPERSGFDLARINSTDNLTRIPPEVHRQISALYSSKPPGFDTTIRDQRDGESWEDQYEYGRAVLNEYLGEQSNDHS